MMMEIRPLAPVFQTVASVLRRTAQLIGPCARTEHAFQTLLQKLLEQTLAAIVQTEYCFPMHAMIPNAATGTDVPFQTNCHHFDLFCWELDASLGPVVFELKVGRAVGAESQTETYLATIRHEYARLFPTNARLQHPWGVTVRFDGGECSAVLHNDSGAQWVLQDGAWVAKELTRKRKLVND